MKNTAVRFAPIAAGQHWQQSADSVEKVVFFRLPGV